MTYFETIRSTNLIRCPYCGMLNEVTGGTIRVHDDNSIYLCLQAICKYCGELVDVTKYSVSDNWSYYDEDCNRVKPLCDDIAMTES